MAVVDNNIDITNQTGQIALTFVPDPGFVGVSLARVRIQPDGTSPSHNSALFDEQHIAVFVNPLAPSNIELVSGPKTHASATTSDDNGPGRELTFHVSGVLEGTTVTLFADGLKIGSLDVPLPASGPPAIVDVDVTTDGSTILPDGDYNITATVTLQDQAGPVLGNFDFFPVDLVSDHSSALALTVERHPAFSSSPVTSGAAATPYSYDAETDEEGTLGLTYALTDSPAGMTIDPATGVVSWTPAAGQAGTNSVIIRAENTFGNFAEQAFDVEVAPVFGDVNGDSVVDGLDANIISLNWLADSATLSQGDANGDASSTASTPISSRSTGWLCRQTCHPATSTGTVSSTASMPIRSRSTGWPTRQPCHKATRMAMASSMASTPISSHSIGWPKPRRRRKKLLPRVPRRSRQRQLAALLPAATWMATVASTASLSTGWR